MNIAEMARLECPLAYDFLASNQLIHVLILIHALDFSLKKR